MKLNCDLGESDHNCSIGIDEQAMALIDLANIACGFHASNPDIMAKTIRSAIQHNVTIGAHPGYNDKQGFGRRSLSHSSTQITHLVAYQTGALQALCQCHGARVEYIKPHGALYNDMMVDCNIFTAILQAAVACMDQPKLMILAQPSNDLYQQLAQKYNVKLLFEAFADRAYTSQGTLTNRSIPGSVFVNEIQIIKQVQQLRLTGSVTSFDGTILQLNADTICVHGDNAASIAVLKQLHDELK